MAEHRADSEAAALRKQRKAAPAVLSAETAQWLSELPAHVRPTEMATRFAHIANKLHSLWPKPQACRDYFDELLLDQRGDRRGFPSKVAVELAALRSHYDTAVFPTSQTIWDDIISRSRG